MPRRTAEEKGGGDDGIRTHDLYVANVPLSQLSYIPTAKSTSVTLFNLSNYPSGCGNARRKEP